MGLSWLSFALGFAAFPFATLPMRQWLTRLPKRHLRALYDKSMVIERVTTRHTRFAA